MKSSAFLLFLVTGLLSGCGVSEVPNSQNVRYQTVQQREKEEFRVLIAQDSVHKKEKAAEALNILLNDADPDRVSVSIQNNSKCDIIVRFSGTQMENLPIRTMKSNHVVLKKGHYRLSANLCNSVFSQNRSFWDSVTITLSENP